MPYKDPEKEKACKREWARRNRKPRSPEEKAKWAQYQKKYRAKLKARVVAILGDNCFINPNHTNRTVYHRIDGKTHRQTDTYILILREKNPKEEWAPLCLSCHRGVHFCMREFGWTWEDILKALDTS